MAEFNVEDYAPVQDRITLFVRDFPDGCIKTRIVRMDGPEVVMEARIFRSPSDVAGNVYTSGIARELEGKGPVNRHNHFENAETSCIGRALANMGYTTNANRPSRSEMLKTARIRTEHEAMLDFIREIGARCEEDATILVGNTVHNLKQFVRDNWGAMKEQYRLARTAADAIEVATGEKFRTA